MKHHLPRRFSRIRLLVAGIAGAVMVLVSGCASQGTPAVYCVNAPGASVPPESVKTAYCINLAHESSTAKSSAATTAAATMAKAPATPAAAASTTTAPAPATQAQAGSAAHTPTHARMTLAKNVDLKRFMGRWYVIAYIPYVMQNGRVGAYYEFKQKGDGKISFDYYSHWPDFKHPLHVRKGSAEVLKHMHDAKWHVTFEWPLHTDFLVLYVDKNYQTALIGYPGHKLGWVLARKPQIDKSTYQSLLDRLAGNGYDVSRFEQVPQTPKQLQELR